MKYKITVSSISLIFFLTALCLSALGQDTVSPQKRALIKELLDVTESVKLAESTSEAMLIQMEQEFPRIMGQVMAQQASENKLTPAQQKALESEQEKVSARMYKRFREKIQGKINYGEMLEQLSVEIYDKYFTEEELKDIISFYKTPTGKKAIQVMPKLTTDILRKSNEIVLPKIMGALNEIIQEEAKGIK